MLPTAMPKTIPKAGENFIMELSLDFSFNRNTPIIIIFTSQLKAYLETLTAATNMATIIASISSKISLTKE